MPESIMATNDPSIADAARIARAISHPVRLQILNELRGNGAYVMHLTAALGRPQANVSQHLMVLREAGLVRAIREGMTVLYQVSDPEVLTVVDTLLGLSQKRMTNRMAASAEGTGSENKRRPRGKCRCPRCRQES
ncbi:MAG TPA: transcriptional regulator [Anaerolineae bacterium]|nr:transcriptional regulator [Anaerolineae bacterium]